ncbi:MAG: MBL fold metallo-hydrolase [Verrucomicrobiota bacterium]|nr:MBL fold metallo-hydrolase [Verrucomicrobiota bacterium]
MSGLEDHAGDIVRKSRQGLGVSLEHLLKVAGVGSLDWEHFESDGVVPENARWNHVCELLALDTVKFQEILSGWNPDPVEQENMPQICRISTDDGGMEVHAYLAWDLESKEAMLFDTGWNPRPILGVIESKSLKLRHLMITHQHHDHVAALASLRGHFPNVDIWAQGRGVPKPFQVGEGQTFSLGSLSIQARWTPGHAEDGVTYILEGLKGAYPMAAVVGDAIFAGSMGGARDHFHLAKEKVREVILSLPASTVICPGHGPMSTVAEEKAHNPMF